MSRLEGRIALVTGASGGIGRGIAVKLAAEGAAVAVHYNRSAEKAAETVQLIADAGGKALAFGADVGQVAEIRALFKDIDAALGPVSILVNNAGLPFTRSIKKTTEEEYDRIFAVNTKAYFFCMQEAALRMTDWGRIIHITSSSTEFPFAGNSVYASSRMVPRVFAAIGAQELGRKGVTVNAVSPGPVAPGMFGPVPDELKAFAESNTPSGRLGTPEDIADVVAFLASEEARWVNGQHLLVNGGAKI
ncbi:MAG: SDR family oxidoreductase [Alphaproteobacteria bacterium]|nr:SDR family oxidoreductase [Alphaproteobacteria bacterium]